MSKILFLEREDKIDIFKPPCNIFLLLYRQKDIDKIKYKLRSFYRNYVIDKLTCEIMENKSLEFWTLFSKILRVVYFPVEH